MDETWMITPEPCFSIAGSNARSSLTAENRFVSNACCQSSSDSTSAPPPGYNALNRRKSMPASFLDHLKRHGLDHPVAGKECGGPAAQGVKPAGGSAEQRAWDFAFATGIECSNPIVAGANGNRLRRDLL